MLCGIGISLKASLGASERTLRAAEQRCPKRGSWLNNYKTDLEV
jgi:hypothetical protein